MSLAVLRLSFLVRTRASARFPGLLRNGLLILLLIGPILGCDRETARPEGLPPNIVLIISDDQGWPDFGFAGSPIVETPNLDSLAQESRVFNYAFNTSSTCRPSLRTLLTGLHPSQIKSEVRRIKRTGVQMSEVEELRHFETLPRLLHERGYASFQGGKYWEGSYEVGGFTHGMSQEMPDLSADRDLLKRIAGGEGLALGRTTMEPLWQFIDQHRDQPFFVWFAPMLPHTPFDAPERYREPYSDKALDAQTIGYYSNVTRFDARVGELLDRLDAAGLRRDTVIVFLTDNGWEVASDDTYESRKMGGAKGKMSTHELGFRTPLLFRWPDRIAPGSDDKHLVSTVDLFVTLLDLAGAATPERRPGKSLWPLLSGSGGFDRSFVAAELELVRREKRKGDSWATKQFAGFMRTKQWRYVQQQKPRRERLYRIDRDPFEEQDVARQHPKVTRQMRERLSLWRKVTNESARGAASL
jgi:arylsulfatase A-like enzyme